MKIHLPAALQQQIFEQMESAYPNEGGGFLLGERRGDEARIKEVMQVDNVFDAAEQHHRYAMTAQDWMQLEDQADARGLLLLGYYHSHPDSPAVPSEYDRRHALPNFVYIITAVTTAQAVEMRAWTLRADRSAFDSETLEVR